MTDADYGAILQALVLAQQALATVPRFNIPNSHYDFNDSLKVADVVNKAIFRLEKCKTSLSAGSQ